MKKQKLLAKTLAKLRKLEFDSENKSQSAGIHIHVNREFFNTDDLIKMRLFFSLNRENLFKISGRKSITNSYCKYEEWDYHNLNSDSWNYNKYYALNFGTLDFETIEIRIFGSTLDFKRLMGYLEFAKAISLYSKEASKKDILGGNTNTEESWNRFKKFVKRKKFRYLMKLTHKEEVKKEHFEIIRPPEMAEERLDEQPTTEYTNTTDRSGDEHL